MSYNGRIQVDVDKEDFYQRKIMRLEDDLSNVHDEMAIVRTKLRVAEDYEIKYEILLKTSEEEIIELKQGNQDRQEKRQQEEAEEGQNTQDMNQGSIEQDESKWKKREYELEQKLLKEADKQLDLLRSERDEYQRKIHQLTAQREDGEMLALKVKKLQKENQGLEQQIEDNRVTFERKKEEQISNQRDRLTLNFKERMATERKTTAAKISQLQKKLVDQQVSKDHELFKLPTSSNTELTAISKLYEEMSLSHQKEREENQAKMQEGYMEVKDLVEDKVRMEEKYKEDLGRYEAEISHLEETLLEKEKEHGLELTSSIQKLNQLREQQLEVKNEQIKELRLDNVSQKEWWSKRLLNHDKEMEELKGRHEDEMRKMNEGKEELKGKIEEMGKRIREHEESKEVGNTELFIAELKDAEVKELHMTNYEDGITFLEGQLTRCQHKLQEKARALQAANTEVANIRVEAAEETAQFLDKLLLLQDEHSSKTTLLEKKILQLQDELKQRQKQIKALQRQNIITSHESDIELNKLKFQLEELRKDYKRVIESKKEMNSNHRADKEKNAGSNSDLSGLKKQKWLEMERQRNELEAIYREKEEQLKLTHDGEMQHRGSELAQLRHRQHIGEKENVLLQEENRKLRAELECNKENCRASGYHHKLATVNLELALTENIYQQILKTKLRGRGDGGDEGHNLPDLSELPLSQFEHRGDNMALTESREPEHLLLSTDPAEFQGTG